MYRPGVAPDTQGLAPGIQGATSAIAGALGTYAGWKRDDVVRADQQQFASGMAVDQRSHESAMIDKRMDRDMQMFGMEKDAQKEQREMEKAMEEEQLRHANTGKAAFLMQSGYDRTSLEAASKMTPKAAAEFLDAGMTQAGMELKARMQAQHDAKQAEEARKSYPMLDPLSGKPDAGYFMTGNGQMVPRAAAKPQPWSPEQLRDMGLKPTQAKIGNVTFGQGSKTEAPTQLRTVKDRNGIDVTVMWDNETRSWVPWNAPMSLSASGPTLDPSNALKSVLSSRQR